MKIHAYNGNEKVHTKERTNHYKSNEQGIDVCVVI